MLQILEICDSQENANFENQDRLHGFLSIVSGLESGRRELNPGPLAPHASALAGLRYAPVIVLKRADYSAFDPFWQPFLSWFSSFFLPMQPILR